MVEIINKNYNSRIDNNTHSQRVNEICDLSIRGLGKMFHHDRGLFCYRYMSNKGESPAMEGESFRYTLITLLGLNRAQRAGLQTGFNVEDITERLVDKLKTIGGIGNLGLLMWLCSEVLPEKIPLLLEKYCYNGIDDTFKDFKANKTMELSWYLTGITENITTSGVDQGYLENTAKRIYKLITKNYGNKGIFGHSSTMEFPVVLRNHIGSFADQVYPIYALSRFSAVFNSQEANDVALTCAEKICKHQGSMGQWWWHYNAKNGKVFNHYPVYSVHQDAMAPTALLEMENCTDRSFTKEISLGLNWIFANNELGMSMISEEEDVIFRSFYKMRTNSIKNFMTNTLSMAPSPKGIHVKYECRPYHLGWILFAFSNYRT